LLAAKGDSRLATQLTQASLLIRAVSACRKSEHSFFLLRTAAGCQKSRLGHYAGGNTMKNNRNPARITGREFLTTTMLATLALSPVVLGSRAIAQTADQPAAANGGGITLPTVEVAATGTGGAQTNPQGVTTSPQNEAYTVLDSSAPLLTDTPILQTPLSVQIVPRQVIDDQQANRLGGHHPERQRRSAGLGLWQPL
jgi:hypothetical protein